MKPSRNLVHSASGLLAVGIYLVMAVASWALFPMAFGPRGNWLSDLGNKVLNPDGALLYRLGGILGGLGLAVFFLTFDDRGWGARKAVRALALLVRVFGTAASAAFIMTGVYSEDMMPMHSWFSIVNFAAFGTAIAFTAVAKWFGAPLPWSFAALCLGAWAMDIVSWVFNETRWLEWTVVAFLVAYVAWSSIGGLRLANRPLPARRSW